MASYKDYGWEDHLTQASSLAKMISVATRGLDDPALQAGLMAISNAIEDHIDLAIKKVPHTPPPVPGSPARNG